MRFYFRLARGVGVSLPWWLAIFVWMFWLAGLLLVGAVWLAGVLLRGGWLLAVAVFGGVRESRGAKVAASGGQPARGAEGTSAVLLGGRETLEVVGESQYQESLRRLAGGGDGSESVRVEVKAVLVPEPENPHDPNAVAVWVDGLKVGHLAREYAALYRPGLVALQREHGRPVALSGVIVGRGTREGGHGLLGVFLDHDPGDFGVNHI